MENRGSFLTSASLPIATAVIATGVFIADTLTRVDIAVAVLYVAVVLLSARFCRPFGVAMVAAGCAALTILSYVITRNTGPLVEGMVNALISLGAIAVITPLVLIAQTRELALRRSEKELRDLLNTMPTIAAVTRADGYREFQSPGWLEYTGLSAEASMGYGWQATVHPDDLDGYVSTWRASLVSGEPFEGEARFRNAKGEYRWFLTRAVPSRDEQGNILKWYAIKTDVDDRKRAEEAARRSEKDLRDLLQNIPAVAFSARPDGFNDYQSRTWFDYSGLRTEDSLGHAWHGGVHPDDLESHVSKWTASLESGQPFEDEVRHRSAHGDYRWFLNRAVPLRDENGKILKWFGILTDIEDRKRAEEAARRSEEKLRDLLDTMPAIAFSARPDGFNEFQSRSWFEYSGMRMEDSLGYGFLASVHPDDVKPWAAKWMEDWEKGEPLPFETEIRYRSAAGEYRWFLVRVVPLCDENGKVLKWFGILADIEDRKRAESLLAGEKHVLEMVAKGDSLDLILDALCRLVEEQIRGGLASIMLVDGDRLRRGGAPNLPKAYTDAIDGAEIRPSAGLFVTAAYRDKRIIVADIATDPSWANYREMALQQSLRACWSTPIFSSQGKVVATIAMYHREPRNPSPRDRELIEQITHLAGVVIEGYVMQEALRRSEAHLAEAQRLTHTGSWARIPTGAHLCWFQDDVYWSEEMFRIWGFDPMQGPPGYETLVLRVHPDDRDRMREVGETAMRDTTGIDHEYRIVLPDGTVKHVHAVGRPILSASGKLIEMVGTVVDVTERKRAQEERERLRQLEASLAHMNRISVMGEMSATVAHELKQPMTAAVMNAEVCLELLQRDQIDIQEFSDATSAILRSLRRGAEIINRLRSLSRKSNPQRELVDINQAVREIEALLRNEARMSSVAVRMELATETPQVTGDRVQLQQVVLNLMLNALESMKETGGNLVLKSELTETGSVLVSVGDTGVGLPEGDEERIFDAFFTTKLHGTGMGLAISRTIVESHGGRLFARENIGPGATFCIELPHQVGRSS